MKEGNHGKSFKNKRSRRPNSWKNKDKETLEIIEDLKSTLEFGTGIGIAAPQIGVNKRIIVVGAEKERVKYNDAEDIPVIAMINPTWKKLSEETDIQLDGKVFLEKVKELNAFATLENINKYNLREK